MISTTKYILGVSSYIIYIAGIRITLFSTFYLMEERKKSVIVDSINVLYR